MSRPISAAASCTSVCAPTRTSLPASYHASLCSARGLCLHHGQRHVACFALWSVDPVLQALRRKRFDPKTVERVYEADVYPAVFDFAAWHQHRSRARYVEHTVTLFRSHFFRDLLGPLAVMVGTAAAVGAYETAREAGLVGGWSPSLAAPSDTPFQLTSFALSLMLVFRTNAAYARWLDARQQWGLLVNTARTFARQAMTTLDPESCAQLRPAVARWTVAFARLSKLHLREGGDVRSEMQGLLTGEELPLVLASSHRPLAACHMLSGLCRAAAAGGALARQDRARLEADISAMSQALGACEKILRNPIPLSYTRHTSRFLILWLLWLPLALWGKVGWGVVPVEAVMCYLLLGIDEIAIQMEEPFGILPLETFCEAVAASVEQVAAGDHAVEELARGYAPAAAARGEPVGCGSGAGPAGPTAAASAGAGNGAPPCEREGRHVASGRVDGGGGAAAGPGAGVVEGGIGTRRGAGAGEEEAGGGGWWAGWVREQGGRADEGSPYMPSDRC